MNFVDQKVASVPVISLWHWDMTQVGIPALNSFESGK